MRSVPALAPMRLVIARLDDTAAAVAESFHGSPIEIWRAEAPRGGTEPRSRRPALTDPDGARHLWSARTVDLRSGHATPARADREEPREPTPGSFHLVGLVLLAEQ